MRGAVASASEMGSLEPRRRAPAWSFLSLFLCAFLFFLVFSLFIVQAVAAKEDRYGAIVVDAATGAVLLEERADRRHYPASLTKMMTLYLIFDALERGQVSLETRLPVSAKAAAQVPSKIWVQEGSTITVQQAIHALAIKSANDVAVVVAEGLAGSEAAFGRKMTAMARRLGMWRTTFFNASGLPDKRQLSTPRDMAKLSRALLYDFPQHYHYFSTTAFRFGSQSYYSHNRLLSSYGGADGIKTGYTRAAGYNISVSAVRQGRRLIVVVFGMDSGRTRNRQAANLLDRAFPQAPAGHPTQLFAQAENGGKLPALRANLTRTLPDSSAPRQSAPPVIAAAPLAPAPTAPAPQPAPVALVAVQPQPAPRTSPKPVGSGVPAVLPQLAATPVSAPQPQRAGLWAIQIGAFSQAQSAQTAGQDAKQALGGLATGQVRVVEVAQNGTSLFRSRIAGLAESDARAACNYRILRGAPCLVVAPES
ncbi:MAG: serine hydrolase [Pseudomonadota bacterium]